MSNTFVVSSEAISSNCRTVLGYDSILSSIIATGTGVTSQDPDYPLSLALDQSYSTEYSPDFAVLPTTAVITFTPSSSTAVNYFTLISKNAQASGLSIGVEVLRASTGIYESVGGFGSMTDGVPVMLYFGADEVQNKITVLAVRVTLTYTAKPYIMSMMCGEAVVFPRTFSLGFQPAHLADIDEVRGFQADEGLNLINSRRLARGYQLEGKINYVLMTKVEEFWKEYSNHVKNSKPISLMWNTDKPSEVIYGIQNPDRLTKPKYKTSLFTEIDFDVVGWA